MVFRGWHQLLPVVLFHVIFSFGGQSQETFPSVEYFGTPLRNNSWIGVNNLGNTSGLVCVTDLSTCCTGDQGSADREWVLPNRTRLTQDGVQEISSLAVRGDAREFELLLADPKAGMNRKLDGVYECVIDTSTGSRQSFFVGLYDPPHENPIGVVELSFRRGDAASSRLVCVSTTRPATAIRWELNHTQLTNTDSTTVLDNPVTSQYTTTLTLDTRQGGLYRCSVLFVNVPFDKTLTDFAELEVEVGSQPSEVAVFQVSPTSVRIFWTIPEPIDQTTGYIIYYTNSTSSGNVTVDGPFISNEFVYGLTNGVTYTFSVAGRSIHFESEPSTAANSPLSLFPGAPALALVSTTVDSVTVSWSVPTGTVVENFDLQWNVMEREQQPQTTSTDRVASYIHRYTISGLSGLQNATIEFVVISINKAGRNSSVPLTFHSNILRDFDDSAPDADTNLGIIIGGAIGIFLVSLVAGIVVSLIATRQFKKRKTPPLRLPPTSGVQSYEGRDATRQLTSFDPATTPNLAYDVDTNNSGTYDYVA